MAKLARNKMGQNVTNLATILNECEERLLLELETEIEKTEKMNISMFKY